LCRGIYRSIVHVPGQGICRLRDTLSRRRHFVRLQAAQVGAVKALLRAAGLGRLRPSLGSEAGWARMIAAVAQHQELRSYAEQHRALWRCAWEQINALDVSLARQQKESFAAPMARLQTIPGVGPIVASTAIAVFSAPERFPDAKHAASYAGLKKPRGCLAETTVSRAQDRAGDPGYVSGPRAHRSGMGPCSQHRNMGVPRPRMGKW
jgi:transposase